MALETAAKKVGLNIEQFKRDIQDESLVKLVDEGQKAATEVGVNSTPTFFIRDHKGNVSQIEGGQSGKEFLDKLFQQLAQDKPALARPTGVTTSPQGTNGADGTTPPMPAAQASPSSAPTPDGVLPASDR